MHFGKEETRISEVPQELELEESIWQTSKCPDCYGEELDRTVGGQTSLSA